MRREVAIVGLALATCAGLSCGGQSADRRVRDVDFPAPVAEYPTVKRPPPVVEQKGDPAVDAEIERVLQRVSEVRELAIRKPQHGRSLGRDALLVNLKQKAKEDLPPDVLRQQGEVYRALELVPLDYDFEAGLLKLLQSEIAGYYDSEDKMMYLIDDLEPDLKAITLNHELIHALQDQWFDLHPMTKYRAGHGDEDSAVQSLIEGDAVNGMFDAAGNPSLMMEGNVVAMKFRDSMAASDSASSAPIFIRDSLVAPYADGFAFVHYLREVDGWTAVNTAFKVKPTSTEQILHPEKFIDREEPMLVEEPTVDALGAGWKAVMADTFGENGFRFTLHAKGEPFEEAAESADGWGGDRFTLAENRGADGSISYALALHLRMDDAASAKQLAAAFSKYVAKGSGSSACVERATLGPLAWSQKGLDFAIVAGPYKTTSGVRTSASNCVGAKAWISAILPP